MLKRSDIVGYNGKAAVVYHVDENSLWLLQEGHVEPFIVDRKEVDKHTYKGAKLHTMSKLSALFQTLPGPNL